MTASKNVLDQRGPGRGPVALPQLPAPGGILGAEKHLSTDGNQVGEARGKRGNFARAARSPVTFPERPEGPGGEVKRPVPTGQVAGIRAVTAGNDVRHQGSRLGGRRQAPAFQGLKGRRAGGPSPARQGASRRAPESQPAADTSKRHGNLLPGFGLRYNGWTSLPARRLSSGAVPGR